jgi:hypothetical protein
MMHNAAKIIPSYQFSGDFRVDKNVVFLSSRLQFSTQQKMEKNYWL